MIFYAPRVMSRKEGFKMTWHGFFMGLNDDIRRPPSDHATMRIVVELQLPTMPAPCWEQCLAQMFTFCTHLPLTDSVFLTPSGPMP